MELTTELVDGALIANAKGRIDSGNAKAFHDSLEEAISANEGGVVIDCEALDYISSAGLRVFLMVAKGLQRQNRPFVICSLSSIMRAHFTLSGFDRIMQIKGTRSEALASFGD